MKQSSKSSRRSAIARLNKAAKSVGCTWSLAWAPANGVSVYRTRLLDPYGRTIVSRIAESEEVAMNRLEQSIREVQAEWRTV